MKKSYQAPKLSNHGTVSQITAASLDSGAQDFLFSTARGTVQGGGGSFDACVTPDKEKCRAEAQSVNRSAKLKN